MLKHYFKLAGKAIVKNKYYTFINVFGLVCGMLSALIIAKYVGGSLHFDSFHINKDRIYVIRQKESSNGNPQKERNTTYWGAGELIRQYPEIIDITRYSQQGEAVIQTDGKNGNRISFVENRIFIVDSSFLKIFTFPFIYGNPRTALSRLHSVVITRSTSKKYFAEANPVGRAIVMSVSWGEETYTITGVVEDTPQQSRFKFNFLITAQSSLDSFENWTVPDCSTFVLLGEKGASAGLENKLATTLDGVAQLRAENKKVTLSLESIANAKLTNTEYLLAVVGIFILLISWVNYINQIIAQSYLRFREVGILSVMGSTKGNLKAQFVVESGVICLTSMILIVIVYLILEPYLQTFTNGHLLPLIGDTSFINIFFVGIFLVGIVTAAFLPTVILFSKNPATSLRNGYANRIAGLGIRKGLIIFQFSISTVLIIGIFVIDNQLAYMKEQDKGIHMENTLIVKDPISTDSSWRIKRKTVELFKAKCAELPFVSEITSSTTVPGDSYRNETYLSLKDDEKKTLVHLTGVNEGFFGMYGVMFVAGHDFVPKARFTNRKSIILSESAAKGLGVSDAGKIIGAKITDHESNTSYDVIGIVRDYHQTSLKYEIKPMAFKFNEFWGHFSLRINQVGLSDNARKVQLDAIKRIWGQVYHDAAFDSFFLSEKFDAQDAEDRYFGKLFECFTILSIVISCSGLFGLSLFISMKRNHEVAIRKTFGATATDILELFLKGYFGSLCVAILLGSPAAYLLMNMWLSNFAYRVDIGFWQIGLAVLSLVIIFFVTVSYHTIKSSLTNPTTVLRA